MEIDNESTEQTGFVDILSGDYWRATEAIPDECITKDMVLLVESVRFVDDAPHTIILRPHPSQYDQHIEVQLGEGRTTWKKLKEHRFLVADFLSKFVPEPNFARLRQQEILAIQGRINKLQHDLMLAETNPVETGLADFVQEGMHKWEDKKQLPAGSTENLPNTSEGLQGVELTTALDADRVAQLKLGTERNLQLATLKADWIKTKTEEISETVQEMTPFYQEQAAAALARTEDVRAHVEKLLKGIESLDLYVGKNVSVKEVKKGKSAPVDVPLTVMQRKLFMDEEMSVFVDVDKTFDARSRDYFFKTIAKYPALVQQIFPTERCIVAFGTTRRDIDYGDSAAAAWQKAQMDVVNEEMFLLVRDGENLYAVWSPVESHLKAGRLFPSAQEIAKIFTEQTRFFGDEDKKARVITFRDVQYTDKLDEHERWAIHYKRFLILLAGLDHRLNLFGTFYNEPKSTNFISAAFQGKYMNFVYDLGGGTLLTDGQTKPTFAEWVTEKNTFLRSGSRVLCHWKTVMNSETAPSVVKERSSGSGSYRTYQDFLYNPTKDFDVKIASRVGRNFVVKVPVSGYSFSGHGDREFEATVTLTKFKKNSYREGVGFIVLDAVQPEELDNYIHDRDEREQFISYIRMFKFAAEYLKKEREQQKDVRAAMLKALADGQIATGEKAQSIIEDAIVAWRATNNGAALPKAKLGDPAYQTLLDQMFSLARREEDWILAEHVAAEAGLKPLRLVLSGNNALILYCEPKPEERDDRLCRHTWVHALWLVRRKNGTLREYVRKWREMPEASAAETTLYEWPGASEWAGLKSPIPRFEDKQALFQKVSTALDPLPLLLKDKLTLQEWTDVFDHWAKLRSHMNEHGRSVRNPEFGVPIGVYTRKDSEKEGVKVGLILFGAKDAADLIGRLAPSKEKREEFLKRYAGRYRAYSHNYDAMKKALDEPLEYNFMYSPVVADADAAYGILGNAGADRYRYNLSTSKRDGMFVETKDAATADLKEIGKAVTPVLVEKLARNGRYWGEGEWEFWFPANIVDMEKVRAAAAKQREKDKK